MPAVDTNTEKACMIPLYTHAIAATVAGALAFGGAWQVQGWRYGKQIDAMTVAAAQLEASQHAALAAAAVKARDTEQALVAKVETIQEESNAQITALATQRDDLRQRLRAAATAAVTARSLSDPASVAAIAAPAAGSDRPEFSGQAGFDLVSEAYRADQIRLQLATCQRQYEAAREALK